MPEFKLAGPRGDGRHPYISNDGAFIGRGVPLLERDALGQWKPRDRAVFQQLLVKGYGVPIESDWYEAQLRRVARALNQGNLALASISLLHLRLPTLPSADRARAMAATDGLAVKYNPDWEEEPRVPAGEPGHGEWTDEGNSGADSGNALITPAAARVDETQARKERFVAAHLSDAHEIADQLGVPVENILALSAIESGWGQHPFARSRQQLLRHSLPGAIRNGICSFEERSKGRHLRELRSERAIFHHDCRRRCARRPRSGGFRRGITTQREVRARQPRLRPGGRQDGSRDPGDAPAPRNLKCAYYRVGRGHYWAAVSYTHLTLPTICSV